MTKKPSIVLGAAGFIGSNLCKGLIEHHHHVRAFDRQPPVVPLPDSPYLEWVSGDFFNKAELKKALEGCEVVYHLISTTIPATSNQNPVYDAESNILGTLNLLELAVEMGLKKVIFISSGGTVYGITPHKAVKEKHATLPICAYGISKLTIEKYLHLYFCEKGLEYTVLRLANPYGPNQRGTGGQGVIGAFINRIKQQQPIEIWGDGMVTRDYVHIGDVVDAMLRVRAYRGKKRLFNIGSGEGQSLNDIIGIMEQILNRPLEKRYTPGRTMDVPVNILDNSLAEKELGWRPHIVLEEGIRELLRLYG